jgi:hypothetical protein
MNLPRFCLKNKEFTIDIRMNRTRNLEKWNRERTRNQEPGTRKSDKVERWKGEKVKNQEPGTRSQDY